METYAVKTPDPVILIIDGAHTLRRAMYQSNLRELSNSTGMPTGAIYGFMQSLKSAISNMSAQSVCIAWEGGHSERRKSVYGDYKRREPAEVEERDIHGYTDYEYYCHQLSWVKMILSCLGIHQISVQGKEGDDIVFQLSRLLKGQKIIISEDSDFFSLVSDKIAVYRPIKKVYVDLANFEDVTELTTPKHYLYSKVLSGDGSDNIPAVAKGVGWKTIKDVLSKIEDPEDLNPYSIIKEAASIKGSRYTKLVDAGVDPIIRNLDLIDISRETFNIFELESIVNEISTVKSLDMGKFNKLMKVLEFSENTIGNTVSRLSMISTYGLEPFIDRDYMRRSMLGITSTLQG